LTSFQWNVYPTLTHVVCLYLFENIDYYQLENLAGVELPYAIGRKYPNAGTSLAWQWVFPSLRVALILEPSSKDDTTFIHLY